MALSTDLSQLATHLIYLLLFLTCRQFCSYKKFAFQNIIEGYLVGYHFRNILAYSQSLFSCCILDICYDGTK